MSSNVDVLMYIHSIEHNHLTMSRDKMPVNSVTISLHGVKVTNVYDANGRLMVTLPRLIAEYHGLVSKPLPPATRPIQQPQPQAQVQQAKTIVESTREKLMAAEVDDIELDRVLEAEIAKETRIGIRADGDAASMAQKLAPRNSGGLLQRAGVSNRNS